MRRRSDGPRRAQAEARRHAADLEWAFRFTYQREPTPIELGRYEYWLGIERRRGFNPAWLEPDQLAELEAVGDPGPYQDWPARPIPAVAHCATVRQLPARMPGEAPAAAADAPLVPRQQITPRRRSPRTTNGNPAPLKHDARLLETLDQTSETEAARRLVRARLANAEWPRSALLAEARLAGIGEAALSAAILAVGAITVGGRLTMPGSERAVNDPTRGHEHDVRP